MFDPSIHHGPGSSALSFPSGAENSLRPVEAKGWAPVKETETEGARGETRDLDDLDGRVAEQDGTLFTRKNGAKSS